MKRQAKSHRSIFSLGIQTQLEEISTNYVVCGKCKYHISKCLDAVDAYRVVASNITFSDVLRLEDGGEYLFFLHVSLGFSWAGHVRLHALHTYKVKHFDTKEVGFLTACSALYVHMAACCVEDVLRSDGQISR